MAHKSEDFLHFSAKENEVGVSQWFTELKRYLISAHVAFASTLTCKGAEVQASGDHLWSQWLSGLSFLKGGLAALWIPELSKPSTSLLPCMGRMGRETFLRSPLDH